ncbi:MAG: hypothetical protein ABFS35_06455 [Bacteroidota bacterium]
MKHLLVVTILFIQITVFSQTVLLQEDISKLDFQMPTSGPNYKHFHQLYVNFSFIIPSEDIQGVETDLWKSVAFSVGWRYKRKLADWFAVGTALSFANAYFSIKQNENKQVPNNIQHAEEKLKLNNINTELFTRLNFGKRGNVIGKFIDFGGYIEYAFLIKHYYSDNFDKNSPPYYSGVKEVDQKDLSFVKKFNYGLKARLGVNRWVITASYRLSDILTDDYKNDVGEYFFPRLAVGVEIGLHK